MSNSLDDRLPEYSRRGKGTLIITPNLIESISSSITFPAGSILVFEIVVTDIQ